MKDVKIEMKIIDYIKLLENHPNAYQYLKKGQIERGKTIVDEYEKSEQLFYIISGFASVEILKDHQRYISTFILPGDICGLDSFSNKKNKKHSIQVISKSMELLQINKEFIVSTMISYPSYSQILLSCAADILQRHYDLFELISLPLGNRVHSALLLIAKQMGKFISDNECQLPDFITQDILARFCQTTQPHISKELNSLLRNGFVIKKTKPIIIYSNNIT